MSDERKLPEDFIIIHSSQRNDLFHAKWIRDILVEKGYSAATVQTNSGGLPQPYSNVSTSQRTIAVISREFLLSNTQNGFWQALLQRAIDANSQYIQATLLPVQFEKLDRLFLGTHLGMLSPVNLIGLEEDIIASNALFQAIEQLFPIVTMQQIPLSSTDSLLTLQEPQAVILNVPFQLNPFFTGREEEVQTIHRELTRKREVRLPVAINGMSGMGKTQLALKYIHQYSKDYKWILWVKSDSQTVFDADLNLIARKLNLNFLSEISQEAVTEAIKVWLDEKYNWLLILDGVNNNSRSLVQVFMPCISHGAILLTTQIDALGADADAIQAKHMQPEEGALFLLRRSKIIDREGPLASATPENQVLARAIVSELEPFPLVLEHAGAFIERAKCPLSEYLESVKDPGRYLSGEIEQGIPRSAVAPLQLIFERIANKNPMAMEILRFCAFLQPTAIYFTFLQKGMLLLKENFALAYNTPQSEYSIFDCLEELGNYSLLDVNLQSGTTYSMHRIVQRVLLSKLTDDAQRKLAEQVIDVLEQIFPEVDLGTWQQCELYLPHALRCVEHITRWQFDDSHLIGFLHRVGKYLLERALDEQAKPIFELALQISQKVWNAIILVAGETSEQLLSLLQKQIIIYNALERYTESLSCCDRALTLIAQITGTGNLQSKLSCEDIFVMQAEIFFQLEDYINSEYVLNEIRTRSFEHIQEDDPMRISVNFLLGQTYFAQENYDNAIYYFRQALVVSEKFHHSDKHSETVKIRQKLAMAHVCRGNYEDAAPMYDYIQSIQEQNPESSHPNKAYTLLEISRMHALWGNIAEAEKCGRFALTAMEKTFGQSHVALICVLEHLIILLERSQPARLEMRSLQERLSFLRKQYPIQSRIKAGYSGKIRKSAMYRPNEVSELELSLSSHDENGTHHYHVKLRFRIAYIEYPPIVASMDLNVSALAEASTDALAYGRILTNCLFANAAVRKAFVEDYNISQTLSLPLKLRLFIEQSADFLHSIRWETLLHPDKQDQPLLTAEHIHFSRFLSSKHPFLKWNVSYQDQRALIALANPIDIEQRSSETHYLKQAEIDAIIATTTQSLNSIAANSLVSTIATPGQVTLTRLIQCLRDGYTILYLVCRGALRDIDNVLAPHLYFEKENGCTEVVTVDDLVDRLANLAKRPQLVVLGSCKSVGSGLALTETESVLVTLGPRLIAAGVPAVLAMQGDISLTTLTEFLSFFFIELHRDGQLDRAMAVARDHVRANHSVDWWIPTLLTCITDSCLWHT